MKTVTLITFIFISNFSYAIYSERVDLSPAISCTTVENKEIKLTSRNQTSGVRDIEIDGKNSKNIKCPESQAVLTCNLGGSGIKIIALSSQTAKDNETSQEWHVVAGSYCYGVSMGMCVKKVAMTCMVEKLPN